jgi:hypothetical protein
MFLWVLGTGFASSLRRKEEYNFMTSRVEDIEWQTKAFDASVAQTRISFSRCVNLDAC